MFNRSSPLPVCGVDIHDAVRYIAFTRQSAQWQVTACGSKASWSDLPQGHALSLAIAESEILVHTQDFPSHLFEKEIHTRLQRRVEKIFPADTLDKVLHYRCIQHDTQTQTWSVAATLQNRITALCQRAPAANPVAFVDTEGEALLRCLQHFIPSLPTDFGLLLVTTTHCQGYAIHNKQIYFRQVIFQPDKTLACRQLQALAFLHLPHFQPSAWWITGSHSTPEIADQLAATHTTPVQVFNPLANMTFAATVAEAGELRANGHAFTLACGLALKQEPL